MRDQPKHELTLLFHLNLNFQKPAIGRNPRLTLFSIFFLKIANEEKKMNCHHRLRCNFKKHMILTLYHAPKFTVAGIYVV
jgi:hypothetical protein